MPKIIVTSRYLKSGSRNRKQLYRYVKYIATREGSVAVTIKDEKTPAAKKQQELMLSLLKDFSDSKDLFEYMDYLKNPNQKTASEFISAVIDMNMDRLTNRENYVGYLANRPGAVKFGAHGLFSQSDEPIDLEGIAEEIANHAGNVWTHVVSLRREDAQKMGYDNLQAWRELVKRQIPNIAKHQKIDLANLKWYAAFHDKETNPHVHIIVYSTNEREGFLTNHGIEKIRSGFANDIYQDELHHLYQQQTDLRNLLKKESAELMQKLASDISSSDFSDAELLRLVAKLHEQLVTAKGKKTYGYLKPEIKRTVDEIFSHLAENELIRKMYALWCEMEQQKHDVYSSARVDFPSLVDTKEFKSVKNMIVRTVAQMHPPDTEISVPEIHEPIEIAKSEEPTEMFFEVSLQTNKQSSKIKSALKFLKEGNSEKGISMLTECADSGDKLSCYKLGKLYLDGKITTQNLDKAEKYLLAADENECVFYALGKLYLTEEKGDVQRAVSYFEQCLDTNAWASYWLGKIYLFGCGDVAQNREKALEYLTFSAEQGNGYAQNILDNMEQYQSEMLTNTIFSLFVNLSRCLSEDYNQKFQSGRISVDKKLRRMMQEKKQALGMKEERTQTQEQSY